MSNKFKKGFSLVELVITIGVVAVVGALVFISMNPGGQVAKARNIQRQADLNTIMNMIRQNKTDNRTGVFSCAAGDIPTSTKRIASQGSGTYNMAPCVVPIYFFTMPFDPLYPGGHYTSNSDYDTGYYVVRDNATSTSQSQITLTAPSAELGQTISITR